MELLTNKFNSLLTQYQDTYQEYLKSIESHDQSLHYSNQLQQINNELMDTNTSIMNLLNSNKNDYSESKKKNSADSEMLNNNYNTLEQERIQIVNMINQYETLNSAYENGKVVATSNYYYYILYLIIDLFLVFLVFKFSLSSSQTGGGDHHTKISPILFLFLACVIIFNSYININ